MTVSSTTRKAGPFNGNGVTTAFPFTFKVFAATDIQLTHTSAAGVQTVKVLNSHYTVALNADQDNNPGGTITYPASGAPLPTGESLVVVTVLANEQTTDISNLGSFLPQVFEDAFDKCVILIQQLAEKFSRTLSVPVGDTATSLTLPAASSRANKTLTFDALGNPTALATATNAAAEAALATAARTAAETAETNAETAETAAEAAQALAQLAASRAESILTGANALAYQYDTAFSIDATIDDTGAAVTTKIGDAVTKASLTALYGASWDSPVMRVLKDGTVGWSDHNLETESGNLGDVSYSPSGLSKAIGYEGPTGELDAVLLTTTATPAFLQKTLSGTAISNFSGGQFLGSRKVYYDGTHRWAYLRIDSPATLRVYFDLQSGTVGTADAGITGAISRYDADGNLMPSGWYMLSAYQAVSATSFVLSLGLSDADANPAVTVGKKLRMSEPQTCYGVKPLPYVKTGALAGYGTPYSWETGGRTLMLYGGATYTGLWSEDLTNAAWTKTNCTAALNATGISGEPCSTLTATAANATCNQVTVSAGTVQTFQPYIRRKTGTGAISITMDNGATWTDITSQINTSTYKRVYLHGVLANPTIGFRISTSGDAIEVCHANNAQMGYVSPPLAVRGTAITMNAIILSTKTIPVSLSGNKVLAYYDGYLVNDTAILSPTIWTAAVLSNSANANMYARMNQMFGVSSDAGLILNEMYGAKAVGERVEVTAYLAGATGGNYCSINGEPLAVDYQRTVTGLDRFTMSSNGSPMQFVRKFLVAPTTIDKRDDVRTKHYQQGIKNKLYAASVVAGAHEFALLPAGSDYERFPVVSLLKDYGDSVLLGVFWHSRGLTPFAPEFPIRLMQRNFVYDKVENTLVPVTNAAVVVQPSRWASNLGGSESPVVIRLTSGANAGRLIMLYNELDSVSGTLTDDKRNVYIKTNDLAGDPSGWTAPVKLFDASVITSPYMLLTPGGDHVILPPSHAVAPNRIVTIYYASGNRVGTIYSDNFGSTWSLGNTITNATPGFTEPTLTMWPNGTLVATVRANGSANNRQWLTSVDGGVNWTNQGVITNIAPDADSSASTVQMDPSGLVSPQGRIAFSHSANNLRTEFQIRYSTSNPLEFTTFFEPVNARRWFSYSSLCNLFGGEYLACAVEYGSYGNVEIYPSVALMVVKP